MQTAIDRRRDWLIGIAESVLRGPEVGFREVKTSRLVSEIGALAFIAKRNLNPLSLRAVLGLAPRHSPMAA